MPSKARGFRLSHGYLPKACPLRRVGIAETRGGETMWVLLIVLVGSAGVQCGFFSSYSLEVLGSQQQSFPDTLRKRNARQHAHRSIGSLI